MKTLTKIGLVAILVATVAQVALAATQYMAVCTEKGCSWNSGWSSSRDDVNSKAKDHERATKGHRWTIKEK
jgi:hypothetical protein